MKHLIIYHANCMDGFGAAWAAYTGLEKHPIHVGASIELFPASYGDEFPMDKLDEETCVEIVDFSYPPEVITQVAPMCKELTILDHHKTAIEKFEGYVRRHNVFIQFDMERSGAMLAWQHYHAASAKAPRLIQHIQDRDLWKFEMMNSKAFHLNLSTFPKDIDIWNSINQAIEFNSSGKEGEWSGYYDEFIVCGLAIQRYQDTLIDSILKTSKFKVSIDGIFGLACEAPAGLASDIGNILAEECGTFGVVLGSNYSGDTAAIGFSIRSIGNVDVSAIAKSFGGGGHKNAAGFKIAKGDTKSMRRIELL